MRKIQQPSTSKRHSGNIIPVRMKSFDRARRLSNARAALIGSIIIAVIGLIGTVILAYVNIHNTRVPIEATETAEARLTAIASSNLPAASLLLITKTPPTNLSILFDETHSEFQNTRVDTQLAPLAVELGRFGYKVSILDKGLVSEQALSEYNILVIMVPFIPPKSYSDAEIAAVENFVRDGGGLLITSVGWSWVDYTHLPIQENPANQLGRIFGMVVNDDLINDPTDNNGQENQPIFHNFADDPIVIGVHRIGSSGLVSSLRMSSTAHAIVWGDVDSYSTYHEQVYEPRSQPVIAAACEFGIGRVVFVGHDGFFTVDNYGRGLYDYDNLQFVLGIFEWLAKKR